MANTYNWDIRRLDAKINQDGLENVIYIIHYVYSAQDESGEYSSSIVGSLGINYDPDSEFIPYNELTKETVVSWLESGIDVNVMKSQLDNEISLKQNPTDTQLTPDWN